MRNWMIAIVMAMAMPGWADTVTLLQDAYVKGPVVRLADIATIEGEHAEALGALEISNAAKPGSTRRIDVSLLRSRIERAGYGQDAVELKGVARVAATTIHLEVDSNYLASNLRDYIETSMPWDPEDAVVDIEASSGTLMLSDGEVSVQWRINPTYRYLGRGTFRGEVSVDGRLERTVYAKATIQAFSEVLVATKGIARGERLSAANVAPEMRDLSQMKSGVFFGVDELEGIIAKSTIYTGQIVTPSKVVKAKIVKRNQLVSVQTQIGVMSIQSQAQAMSDGVAGDILTCRNLTSKEEFTGILRKDGVVVVN